MKTKVDKVARDLRALVDFRGKGLSLRQLDRLFVRLLVPHLVRYDRPEFQSFFNAAPEPGAALGGRLALRFNQGVTNWQVSPGGAMLEELCVRALGRLFGFPAGSDATFMYCGTYANQQALYMALHRRAEQRGFDLARRGLAGFDDPSALAVVASEHAHLSLRHAVRMLGLGEQSLVLVPAGRNHRLDPDRLRTTLESLAGGRDVFAIVLTAGNTATGSVDPILPAVRLCRGLGTWLHVDGAYGLAYSLVPEFRPLFEGFARADSVSWDPHKQMGVPVPNSVLFVRRKADFARMAIYGEYFNRKDDPAPNPGLKSPPTTRPMAALPLVASLRHQGLDRVIARLKGPCLAVRGLARRLRGEPDIDLVNDPDTGILCFRMTPPGCSPDRLDALQKRLFERITAEGRRSISITRIHGRVVLRLVAISPAVTERALWKTVVRLRELAKEESGFSRRRS